jgi:hypothetical protein
MGGEFQRTLLTPGEKMKRTFAAVVTAVLASTSVGLATGPAYAKPKPPAQDSATIKVVPKWTYSGGGKLAVIDACSYRHDLHVVSSKMLPHPVNLRGRPDLLIEVTGKTKPGKYAITLSCVTKGGQVDAADMTWVKVQKRLSQFRQPRQPTLPRHFKATVTVESGPLVMVKIKR